MAFATTLRFGIFLVEMRPWPNLVVVDTDPGLDDAWALVLLLSAQRAGLVRLLAVTAISGNAKMNDVLRNACRTLQISGAADVPVYRGAPIFKIESNRTYCNWYGCDGFCNVKFDWEPDLRQIQRQYGPRALTKLAAEYPGEISLICLGPLHNIGIAMQLDPNFTSNLKDIFILGGDYPDPGPNSTVEFNFQTAPDSANKVLTQARCPVTVLPFEPSLNINLPTTFGVDTFRNSKNPPIQMLVEIEKAYIHLNPSNTVWFRCDLVLAACFLNKRVVKRSLMTYGRVQVDGPRAGLLTLNPCKKHKVEVITEVDSDQLREEVLKAALV